MIASIPAGLSKYREKRDFKRSPEPAPHSRSPRHKQPIFVVQEHHARSLHFDFRLEHAGVLKSWAVPKEPSMDPAVKRLAVQVEDHPISYATFAGTIPAGSYGAGNVSIWDRGTFELGSDGNDFDSGLDAGKIEFVLHGKKLNGRFALVRMGGNRGKKNWLLIKMRDEFVDQSRNHKPRAPSRSKPAAMPEEDDATEVKIEVTNGDKIWFPNDGITKGEIFRYYEAVADRLLPFLLDRPMTLERLPDGIGKGKPHFWQKHTPAYYPRSIIPRVDFETERGKSVEYALVNNRAALLYLVNQGTLTFHPWLSRLGNPNRPDFVLFDLDPGETTFANAVDVARQLHEVLDRLDVASVPKTSGKTGLHVLVAWTEDGDFDVARAWAKTIADHVAATMPQLATTEFLKAKRGKRVYIDIGQNARAHHAVPPYVVRPVDGAPVSMPLEWKELTNRLRPSQFTIKTAIRRLNRQKKDPMAELLKSFDRN